MAVDKFFPRIFALCFFTCKFVWRFSKCFLKHFLKFLWYVTVEIYLHRDPEEIEWEDMTARQKWKETANVDKEELEYTYWGDGRCRTIRINPFWERDYMDDEQNEFFKYFRPANITREGVVHYLTEEELQNDSSNDFYIGKGYVPDDDEVEKEVARKYKEFIEQRNAMESEN